ncbi:MAG: FeoA family protein [Hyphomicrobiaceae bacterium]
MTLTLDQLPDLQACTVTRIRPPANAPEWRDWLEEIGFLPGERVMVMTRALPGGDPLVIRVGSSTFALRRVEAACVQVALEHTAADGTAA